MPCTKACNHFVDAACQVRAGALFTDTLAQHLAGLMLVAGETLWQEGDGERSAVAGYCGGRGGWIMQIGAIHRKFVHRFFCRVFLYMEIGVGCVCHDSTHLRTWLVTHNRLDQFILLKFVYLGQNLWGHVHQPYPACGLCTPACFKPAIARSILSENVYILTTFWTGSNLHWLR